MTLKQYLKKHGIRPEDFAAKIGYSRGAMLKWVSGERFPRPEAISRIADETNGKVTANDFASQQVQR
jgi:transcriptional regulator with XRE-family HTH domain